MWPRTAAGDLRPRVARWGTPTSTATIEPPLGKNVHLSSAQPGTPRIAQFAAVLVAIELKARDIGGRDRIAGRFMVHQRHDSTR